MRGGTFAVRPIGFVVVLRALLRQRRRLLLAGVSIALGVGYLAGTLGLLDRIGAGLDQLASATADNADVVIEGEVAYESSLEQVRRLVPAEFASMAREIDGVESASHRLEDVALILDSKGNPVAVPGLSEQPLGVNWPEDSAVSNLELIEGAEPASDDEVVIDAHSAEAAGVGVGDEVRVAGKGKVGDYLVSGIVDADGVRRPEGSSLVALTTAEARLVFDQPTDDNRIAVMVSPGADVDSVMTALRAVVPSGSEVTDGASAARHAQESLTRSFTLVRVLVTSFGVLALLVGMVTVANSLTLLHSQRRRMFAGFRLVGAGRGQLRRAALGEAVLLALVSAIVGIPLGLAIAVLIEQALGALGTAVPTAGPLLTPAAVITATGVGVLATVAAAWRPVRSACSVPPIEAIGEGSRHDDRRHPLVVTAIARALLAGVVVAAVGVLASLGAVVVVGVALGLAVLVFLATFLPVMLTGIVSWVMRILPFRPRPLRLIAARDARRNPRRTAATTAAVLLAAAVVSGLAVFLQSFTASVDKVVADLVTADLVVDSETFTRGGLPADLTEQLGYLDGVEAVSAWQLGRGSVGESPVRMTGLDGDAAAELIDPGFVGEAPSRIDTDSAWISESLAERTDIGVGDELPLAFYSGGFESLSVSGVYTGGESLLGDVVIDRSVLLSQVPATPDLFALVGTDGSLAAVESVRELSASYGVPAVLTPEEFVGERGEMLRGFERVVLWMLLFTLLQALVGVVNTLMLSVGERRREFGLLRVAGTTRRALLQMVLFEGVSFSSVGTLLGVVVGTAAAAAGVMALGSLGLGVFTVPFPTLALIGFAAMLVGVAAAWFPARMAAAVPPLDAVTDIGAEPVVTRAPRPVAPVWVPEPARAPVAGRRVQPAPKPPPFDPARVPWPLTTTWAGVGVAGPGTSRASLQPNETARPGYMAQPGHMEQPNETVPSRDAVLSVAVLDGSSVLTLAADSQEAHALLALYGMLPEPSVDAAPFGPLGVDSTSVPPAVEAAIEHLLGAGLFAPDTPAGTPGEAGVQEAGTVEPAAPTEPLVPPVLPAPPPLQVPAPSVPTPDWGPSAELPAEPVRDRRRPLRRSRHNDPADRRPPRRARRKPLSSPSEGWVASAPDSGPPSVPEGPPSVPQGLPSVPQGAPARGAAGLSPAVGRLDPLTRERWAAVLHSMNAALANGEHVGPLVCGRVHAAPAAVARTDRRLLVVAQRPGRMAVESLHPIATGVIVRPGPGGTLVVALIDRGRHLEISDVRDAEAAESLVLREALPSQARGSFRSG